MCGLNKKKYIFILTIVILLSSSMAVFAETDETQAIFSEKEVLILSGFQYGLPVTDIYSKSIVDSLRASGVPVSNIFVEYLDLNRKDNDSNRLLMQEKLLDLSINHSIELIIAIDQVAADFIVHEGKDLFEGAPLIVSYDEELVWEGPPRNLIIAAASNDAEGTVRYAFELFSNTQNVILIEGKGDEKAPFLERLITAVELTDQRITIERTNNLPYSEMLERIAVLPPDTIAFYGSYFQDVTSETHVPAAVANTVGRTANAPVFAFVDQHIKQGLVGGSVVINEKLGQLVAQVALDYFSGTLLLTDEPIRVSPDFYPLFDWQQLKRWGADPTILPDETIFLNYTPTLWESHRELILVTSLFIVLLIFLVVLLFISNRTQKTTLERLHESESEVLNAYDETIKGWSYAVDLKDKETENHSMRVTNLTRYIAEKFGVKDEDLVYICRGALLHDIGKMGIPDSILLKPDKLSDEEWEIMRKHPIYAYDMLSKIDYLGQAIDIPYCHHEKWDGSGYPRGLKGEEIPLAARIFAIVDVYDALTSHRPYREAWTKEKALEHIKEQSGKHFDPQVVDVFVNEVWQEIDRID